MSLTKLTTDLDIVTALDTEPNDVGGLTAAQLKAKFDEGPNAIKNYINNTLTEEAASKADLQGIVLGQIPDGTITGEKLDSTLASTINTAVQPSGLIDTSVSLSDAVKTALNLTGTKYVADALSKLSGTALRKTTYAQLSNLSDGTDFTLNETISGITTAVTFVKLKNNYEGSGRVLVVRKAAIAQMPWRATGGNAYSGADIDNYLDSTYVGYLDSNVQAQISNVSIPYTIGNGNATVTTLSRKCFALSCTEVGYTDANANTEGSTIPYYSVASNRAANQYYWTRTPMKSGTTDAFYVHTNSNVANQSVTTATSWYVRPAFTLPTNFEILESCINTLTDMTGADFPLAYAKISTGSYTGTGTYGSSSPNSLTFDFKPKVLLMGCEVQTYGAFPWVAGQSYGVFMLSGSAYYVNTTWSENSVSWYNTTSANNQFNATGSVYHYVAIG